jgi:prepilin-type N-terminal cleavage/methylation domain-containing protein
MRFKNKPAFSLIEILAVLFIVSIALVGVMMLAHQSIRAQRLNKHTLIAYQLAQEGIELVRAVRDTNWKKASPENFEAIFSNDNFCIDYEALTLNISANPCPLYLVDGYYKHRDVEQPGDQISPYSRLIKIEFLEELPEGGEIPENNRAVHVSSHIYWDELGGTFEYVTATELYDWFEVR